MNGVLERLLVRLHGAPELVGDGRDSEKWWRRGAPDRAVLFTGVDWQVAPAAKYRALQHVYGGIAGGMIAGDSLKVAMLSEEAPFGLWTIDELQEQPEVLRAKRLDPHVDYFMDAANVWFYGHKDGRLFVYDAETDELDDLGELDTGLAQVIEGWQSSP